ncbi:bifunctional folylpolyglutamate synthase/dihydrofolate synthase [Gracilimonas mengyeensis]|uniref:Dihydrofolate synthase/folylpolyglutamate synthase n=1 Tax=Gracilimonas mengyeensis TaxID=1302730 RepID=A0A521DW52_9BACT|nr:folylpolyglutamate synthase/dihydrofolate synthase family protein [Gracilimonas mengyeensis]SMO75943.1 dihydrofolate synthase / folylpolyglutamate synthase [Gracilimonas mengyeensis]
MSRFTTIDDVWAFLDAIPMFQKKGAAAANFSLDNIREFCARLGDPQNTYPTIHVAGTNGKGTTCHLLEKMYGDAGYKTGLFTSPHLLRYNERVRVAGEEISDGQLVRFFQRAEPLFDEIRLSYFEISTALAFWYFAEEKVDIAIIETGLGGRLDSTNIIKPEVSVITSVGLDHQSILGDTLPEIAREKAGIIKNGKPVVVGNVEGAALKEIKKVAEQHKSELYLATELHPRWTDGVVEFSAGSENYKVQTKLLEKVNRWNIAVAWLVAEVLDSHYPLEKKQRLKSIADFSGAPGRFEKLHPDFDWYFSGSHNAQALEASLEAIEGIKPRKEAVLVFSVMQDKWNPEMADYFSGFKESWFAEQEGDRAMKWKEIKALMPVKRMDEANAGIILKELQTELVIFMGSFYFYPTVKRWITNHQH